MKARLQPGWRLSDGERATLAEIGKRLGRKGLQQVARLAKPDTILAWYRRLVAEKFDGSKQRRTRGRPRTSPEIEDLVVRLARENSGWGYDRIVGALANLGHPVSDQTVGNILRRHGIAPVPERSKTTTWRDFIRPDGYCGLRIRKGRVLSAVHAPLSSLEPSDPSKARSRSHLDRRAWPNRQGPASRAAAPSRESAFRVD